MNITYKDLKKINSEIKKNNEEYFLSKFKNPIIIGELNLNWQLEKKEVFIEKVKPLKIKEETKKLERALFSLLNECKIIIDEKYVGQIFYIKNNRILFKQDTIRNRLYITKNYFPSFFFKKIVLDLKDKKEIYKSILKKNLILNDYSYHFVIKNEMFNTSLILKNNNFDMEIENVFTQSWADFLRR